MIHCFRNAAFALILVNATAFCQEVSLKFKEYTPNLVIKAIAFSPDGRYLAVTGTEGASNARQGKIMISSEGQICILEVNGLKLKSTLGSGIWPGEVCFSGDGTKVMADVDYAIQIWTIRDGIRKGRPRTAGNDIQTVVFSGNACYALTQRKDDQIEVFDLDKRKSIRLFPNQDIEGNLIAGDSGEAFFVYVADRTLFLKNLSGGEDTQLGMWKYGSLVKTALSQDQTMMATSSSTNQIILWDLEEKKQLMVNSQATSRINDLAFSPDGAWLVYGGVSKGVYLWNLKNPEILLNIGRHDLPVTAVAFSANSQLIASGSFDGRIQTYSIDGL